MVAARRSIETRAFLELCGALYEKLRIGMCPPSRQSPAGVSHIVSPRNLGGELSDTVMAISHTCCRGFRPAPEIRIALDLAWKLWETRSCGMFTSSSLDIRQPFRRECCFPVIPAGAPNGTLAE